MQLIENNRLKAVDFLSAPAAKSESLSVVSAIFSIYAFDSLAGRLPHLKRLRLLLSSAPNAEDPFALIGDPDERSLRNRLTQQFVAERCRAWLEEKGEIRGVTGVYSVVAADPEKRRAALAEIRALDVQIADLRRQAKGNFPLAEKIALNVKIKALQRAREAAKEGLA